MTTPAIKFDLKATLKNFSNVGTIFRKELRSYFNSPVAYVVIIVFLGFIEWFYASDMFKVNLATMRDMFTLVPWIFVFVVPAITMRLIAEERKAGTIELLTTRPLNDAEIVLGKFLAAWALICISLLPTLVHYITIAFLGDIDHGPVIGGYLGLMLMAGVFVAVGLFASSLTENQIVAMIIGLVLMFALMILDKILIYVPEFMNTIVEFIGVDFHFSNIARGVIDSRDIIYFASILGFMLYLSTLSLGRRKW
ncbi:MAG: ABC transporter permease subunit [Ignavibacteriales bacterium]|nr:ABC transporter permease subunit [Ignavibacteriales bacterium]